MEWLVAGGVNAGGVKVFERVEGGGGFRAVAEHEGCRGCGYDFWATIHLCKWDGYMLNIIHHKQQSNKIKDDEETLWPCRSMIHAIRRRACRR